MKKFLSIILALAMTIALIPAVSAETGDSKVFRMYGGNFVFTPSEEQVGDHASFNDTGTNATGKSGYITFNDGAYVSSDGSNYYAKGSSTSTNIWTVGVNIKNVEVNGVSITSNKPVPRFRVAVKSSVNSKENCITFKFKVGESAVAKNYTVKTETYKRENVVST